MDWSSAELRFLDVSGDGRTDLLFSESEVFVCYRAEGRRGFRTAARVRKPRDDRQGAAVVFSGRSEAIFLADMTGDGLSDIVRITAGGVEYWPNLGHGKFGRKITMESPPAFGAREELDPARIRLVDIDGTGPTDLLYLDADGATLWFNECGNRFSEPRIVRGLPLPDRLSEVSALDFLGRGTACLVWSTARPGAPFGIAYVDLLAGTKPYLLNRVRNNLGSETRISYAPSTEQYLADRAAGRPWLTRLHFPVHVVTRVENEDLVSAVVATRRFAHHHGYFDPHEREFHGFAMVETWDGDDSATSPPVLVRTWFSVGAELDFSRDYDRSDPLFPSPPQPVFSAHGHRAMRGRTLREEIYAEDNTPRAASPYVVREFRYEARELVAAVGARPPIFAIFPERTVEARFDREPNDPRILETRNLEVDNFGAVRRSAAIAHPRRAIALYSEQTTGLISSTETDVVHTDGPDDYRIGTVIASRRFELLSFDLSFAGPRRLRQHVRSRYYADDLAGPLPLGAIGARALLYDVEALAFTADLLADIYAGAAQIPTAVEMTEGGYRQDGAGWWSPSSRVEYDPARFFLPIAIRDPFGALSTLDYDGYALLPRRFVNVLQREVTAENDYWTLGPRRVTDENRMSTEAVFDALAQVVGIAVSGAAGEGDTPADPRRPSNMRWMSGGYFSALFLCASALAKSTRRRVRDGRNHASSPMVRAGK